MVELPSVPTVVIKGRPNPAPNLTRLTPAGEKLLNAASELFYARGIHAVGVDAIAAMAGTTKKTLYDRFGSKDVLVALYLQRRAERWRRFVEEHLAVARGNLMVKPMGSADSAPIGESAIGCDTAPRGDGATGDDDAARRMRPRGDDDAPADPYEAAVQRVLTVLDALAEWNATLSRGCAFINAFAEIGGGDHPGVAVIRAEKDWTRALYAGLLRESGLKGTVTEDLAAQLAMLQEGALTMWTAGGMPDAIRYAREAARRLIATALDDVRAEGEPSVARTADGVVSADHVRREF